MDKNLNIWDQRYSVPEYIYGILPNEFFKEQIELLTPGKLLLPAEGEGRNAIFATKLGWTVSAFDSSEKAKAKATELARKRNVTLDYHVTLFADVKYPTDYFDAIALVFIHLPREERTVFFRKLITYLKPGGSLILECFSKEQLQYSSGGPKDENMLYSTEEMKSDFGELKILMIGREITMLDEGPLHQGEASVIRLVAKKL